MEKMVRTAIAVAAISLMVSAALAAAAPPPDEVGALTLGSGSGVRGRNVQVPIYLDFSGDQQWDRVVATLDYPAALTYVRAEVGKEASEQGALIEAKEIAPPAGAKTKRLEITIKGGKGKALPAMTKGSLSFSVDKNAKQQLASLPVVEVKGFSKGSRAEAKLRANPGNIAIFEAETQPVPDIGCFFFTH